MNFKSSQKGFTIVETIVALAILGFGIISVYGAFSAVVASTYNISARFTAAYLAQEGVEIVRSIRDDNFIAQVNNPTLPWSTNLTGCGLGSECMTDYQSNTLSGYNGAALMLDSNTGFYNNSSGTPTLFKRRITINPVAGSPDILDVTVSVTWDYNGKSFSFDANEYLYNWY